MAGLPEPAVATGRDGDDQQVQYQSIIVEDGDSGTVVRDAAGHILYPTYVPQGIEWLASSTSHRSESAPNPTSDRPGEGEPLTSTGGLQKVETDPVPGEAANPRPLMGKKFVTELPHRNERRASTLPPRLQRAGTNLSKLDEALLQHWEEHKDAELSSSSSSSEDERDEEDETRGDDTVQLGKPDPEPRRKKAASDPYRRFRVGNEHYHTKGKVSKKDGRLNISVKDTSNKGYLAKALGAAARSMVPPGDGDHQGAPATKKADRGAAASAPENVPCPKLNIVIMVIGSRGDAQPFLRIGKVLQDQYGHRVRIATHPAFREFVERDSGLEFFSVGGDPAELMAFMVKNPGMIPTLETVRAGDIGRRRAAMAEMFEGFWRSCINATDNEKDVRNLKMMGEKDPFVADAIIANPPSFAHVHCAEALGIPLHLMFTFPYTPTQAFPHPLASIKKTNVDPGYANFISYPLVEMMVWQGLGDLVNDFRVKTLGLDPVSTLWAPGATYRMHVPFTYLWSPGLVPKPEDWGAEIDISGFVFLDLASSFTPPASLVKFLDAGPPPVYIGFGSIVVDDPARFTEMVFEGVRLAGVRALVSKGWGHLGNDQTPDNIYMLDNIPHDYLFPRVSACVIHGGAGTTAMALKCGRPTFIVPFFGDQHFWGPMVAKAGAGPEPVPYKNLTAEKLAKGIKACLTEEALKAAGTIAKEIEQEGDGAENACRAFHRHLELSGDHSMRCSILEDRVAAWRLKNSSLRLSPLAADIMVARGYATWKKLRLVRHKEWNDFEGPGEPVTGAAGSLASSVKEVFRGVGGVPVRLAKSSNKRRARREKKKKRKEEAEKAKAARANDNEQNGQAIAPSTSNGATPEPAPGLSRATTTATDAPCDNPVEEFVESVGRGVGKSASALARAPVELALALAQGFHNAPRLYGDDTVRRPPRVTGIRSGLRAARHELAYGVYDGVTGLVRLPARGARASGVRGFVKGMGMGVTGLVLKDIGAIIAPVGYTFKGIIKQLDRRKQPARVVRRARIRQGQRELQTLSGGEKEDRRVGEEVERKWQAVQQLWDKLDEHRKAGSGLSAALATPMGTREAPMGATFASAERTEQALDALRKGEDIEAVLGEKPCRHSFDFGLRAAAPSASRKSHEASRSSSKSSARWGTRSTDGQKPLALTPSTEKAKTLLPEKRASGSTRRKVRASEAIAEDGEATPPRTDVPDDMDLTEKRDATAGPVMVPSEAAGDMRRDGFMNLAAKQ